MRKYLIALVMILVSSFSVRAQVRFGVSAGGDGIALGLTSTSGSSGYGASAGVFADWTFSDELPVIFRAEVNWSASWEKRFDHGVNLYCDEDRSSRFVSIPLMLGYGFVDNRLRVTLGEEISYAYSVNSHQTGSVTRTSGVYENFDKTVTWSKGDYNPWRTSVVFGAEYMVLPSLGIKAKFLQTLGHMPGSSQDDVTLAQVGVNIYFN